MPLDPIRPSTPTTTDQSLAPVTNDSEKAPDQLEQQEPVTGRAFSRNVKAQAESDGKKFVSAIKRQAEGHSGPPVSLKKRLAKGWDSFKGIFTRNRDSYTLAQPKETGHKKEAQKAKQRATRIANEVATTVSTKKQTNVETVKPLKTKPEPPPKPKWLSEQVKSSQPQRHHSAPAGITPRTEATQKPTLEKSTSNPPDFPAPKPPTPDAPGSKSVRFNDEVEVRYIESEEENVYESIPDTFQPRAELEQKNKLRREVSTSREILRQLQSQLKAKHTAWRTRFAINRLQKKHDSLVRKQASLEEQAAFLNKALPKLLAKHSSRIGKAGVQVELGSSFKQRSITEGTLTTHSPAPTIPAPPEPTEESDDPYALYDRPRARPQQTSISQRRVTETAPPLEDQTYVKMQSIGSVINQTSPEPEYANAKDLDELQKHPEQFVDFDPNSHYENLDALGLGKNPQKEGHYDAPSHRRTGPTPRSQQDRN
ncbi:hypothetical protein ACWJJH_16740 [Endozoicomonadaceae bacterium StTr2]